MCWVVHATNFAESTRLRDRIEKYSSLADAFFFFNIVVVVAIVDSQSPKYIILWQPPSQAHFGQLIITAMGMSKIFKSIHPTYQRVVFFRSVVVARAFWFHSHFFPPLPLYV